MQCRIDHTELYTIPKQLCRACRPKLNTDATTRAVLDQAERDKNRKAEVYNSKLREIATTEGKLARASKREHAVGSVGAKIALSLTRKLERLQEELRTLDN